MKTSLALVVVACVLAGLVVAAEPTTKPATKAFPPVADQAHLHNGHVVTDKVISGAQPEGNESFKALQKLGVKTIISVDGAKPDVERARRFGMRYVHMPIGYDGVSDDRARELAKAIAELPGPVYVHCHHGRHRSAAAVAVACVYNGMLKPAQAESVLQTFGTGKNYTGLWSAARDAKPLSNEELAALKVDYVETASITGFAEAMVGVDRHWDHVKETKEAGWKVPADHPDLDPAHEALQTVEHLREAARMESTGAQQEEFRKMLNESEIAVTDLATILNGKPIDTTAADEGFKRVAASCTACHKAYRD